jgi:hypothetical protein
MGQVPARPKEAWERGAGETPRWMEHSICDAGDRQRVSGRHRSRLATQCGIAGTTGTIAASNLI